MAFIVLSEVKQYLRVDTSDEDAPIGILLSSAERLCIDVGRFSEEQWTVINSDAKESELYTKDQLLSIRETMKIAVLYTVAYLFEHREEADHHALTLTLRSILFAVREGVNE